MNGQQTAGLAASDLAVQHREPGAELTAVLLPRWAQDGVRQEDEEVLDKRSP